MEHDYGVTSIPFDRNEKSESLTTFVLDQLQQSILNGSLKPGDYLPSEKQLSEMLGVGKSSVREAMTVLKVLGVVECQQGRNSRIATNLGPNVMMPMIFELILANSSSNEFYEFRNLFEVGYMQLAATKATDKDRERVKLAFKEYEHKARTGRISSSDDIAYHKVFMDIAGNSFVTRIGMLLFSLCRNYLDTRQWDSQMQDRAINDHKMLMEFFCDLNSHEIQNIVAITNADYIHGISSPNKKE